MQYIIDDHNYKNKLREISNTIKLLKFDCERFIHYGNNIDELIPKEKCFGDTDEEIKNFQQELFIDLVVDEFNSLLRDYNKLEKSVDEIKYAFLYADTK